MIEFIKTWHFLIIMLTSASILVYIWLYLNRNKLNAKWWEILIVTIVHCILGVLSVKFFAILEVGFDMEKAGNFSLFGGVFFMPVFYLIYALIKKVSLKNAFDIFVIELIIALFFSRMNCLHAGCCVGKIIDGTFRFPTREVELVFDLIILLVFVPWIYKGKSEGRAYPIYMISYGIARFILESFREADTTAFMHRAHYWSIISFVVGASILAYQIIKARRAKTDGNE